MRSSPVGSRFRHHWGHTIQTAVLVEKDGVERLYLVVETKAGLFADDVREKEHANGKAHFKALAVGENRARYCVARSADNMFARH
jgi:type III restriction enzyme